MATPDNIAEGTIAEAGSAPKNRIVFRVSDQLDAMIRDAARQRRTTIQWICTDAVVAFLSEPVLHDSTNINRSKK